MKIALTLIAFLFSSHTFATIWITLSDPASGKIGVIGASSGYIGDYRTMVPVDNHGIAVVGSWYLGKKQDHLISVIRNPALTAHEATAEMSRLINLDSHKRRVSFVNARFENASVPGRGCHANNKYCGKYEDPHFTITGGGLVSENVILAARDVLADARTEKLPFECRLYLGMKAVFDAGGEYKTIERVALAVDDLSVNGDNKMLVWFRKGAEDSLLKQLSGRLSTRGLNCGEL